MAENSLELRRYDIRFKALNYANANSFLKELRDKSDRLTITQMHDLRLQALAGDVDGAKDGLRKIIMGKERY